MAVIAGAFGLCRSNVRMLPARLALCDLEAPGWGEPRFPHGAFSQIAVWHFRGLLFALGLFCHPILTVIQCYHLF